MRFLVRLLFGVLCLELDLLLMQTLEGLALFFNRLLGQRHFLLQSLDLLLDLRDVRFDVRAFIARHIVNRFLERFGASRRKRISGDLDLRAHFTFDLSGKELRLPLELDGLRLLMSAAE